MKLHQTTCQQWRAHTIRIETVIPFSDDVIQVIAAIIWMKKWRRQHENRKDLTHAKIGAKCLIAWISSSGSSCDRENNAKNCNRSISQRQRKKLQLYKARVTHSRCMSTRAHSILRVAVFAFYFRSHNNRAYMLHASRIRTHLFTDSHCPTIYVWCFFLFTIYRSYDIFGILPHM